MNKVILIGRLTAKPELRYTPSNIACSRFAIAVNRNYTNEEGKREADFINVLSWRKQAETICKYFDKGSQIAIEGRLQSGSYDDKDENKRYTLEVALDNFEFVESRKKETEKEIKEQQKAETDPFAEFGEQVELDISNNFLD